MRSDDKFHGAGRSNDISADELLALLNKSVGYKSGEAAKPSEKTSKSGTESLKIDDDV